MASGRISVDMDQLCGCIAALKNLSSGMGDFGVSEAKRAGSGSAVDGFHSLEKSTAEYANTVKKLIQCTIDYLDKVKTFEELDGNFATPRSVAFTSEKKIVPSKSGK